METDVRASSDNVALTFHDSTLARVAGGDPRAIAETPWSRLSTVRVHGRGTIARLDDALASFPDLPFNIDVKAASAIEPTVEAIARTGAGLGIAQNLISSITATTATTKDEVPANDA